MADFESIIKTHVAQDGTIPGSAINAIVAAINNAVGNEYVAKDRYKAKLAEIDQLKEKQQTAEDSATTAEKWKDKYADLKKEFDGYKADVANKETLARKKAALTEIAKDAGLSEAGISKAVKYAEWDKIELDEKGAIKDKTGVMKGLKEEWPEYITTTKTVGADTPTPPASEQKADKGTGANPRAAELSAKYTNSLYGVGANNEKKGD